MDTFVKGVGAAVIVCVMVVAIGVLLAFPVMWLMNGLFTVQLLTAVFGVPHVTFWTALGFNTLTGILFKSHDKSSSSK